MGAGKTSATDKDGDVGYDSEYYAHSEVLLWNDD
jgi:hypothetical protein